MSRMNCVKGEIHNVLSMMRVNARWASLDRFTQEIPAATQSPMMRAFKQLHYELQTVPDLSDVDTVTYLLPFVMVIESDKTSGYITGAAISSLNKFLLYGLITNESLRADVAINRIAVCVSRCRFEETHRADDEAVLMKLLELVEYCVRCEVGPLITGENLWKMVQLCYSISVQPRSSLHLSRAAENTLAHLVLTVFDRIDELEPKKSIATDPRNHQHNDANEEDAEQVVSEQQHRDDVADKEARNRVGPYGIPLLEKVLQFLASLISPTTNDETTCVLGLRLINIVLETAGTGLGNHLGLVSVLQGDLSKFLLQNSETDELAILSLTLRVVFNLFNSIKDHLKVQLEVFFTSVHMRIIDSRSCSDEQKELALESLLEFCREPALMLDLYVNYDCDVHCTNLFEVLCKSLARNCQAMESDDGSLNALSLLCLEGLLAVIDSIARRCPLTSVPTKTNQGGVVDISSLQGSDLARFTSVPNGPPQAKHRSTSEISLDEISPMSSVRDLMQLVMSGSDSETDSDPGDEAGPDQLAWLHTARERTAEVLQQRKKAKKRYALAADKFNTDQKNWIAFSQQIGLLPEKLTPESVASFLLHTPGLNKTLIGDYIGDGPVDKYPFNTAVRDAYIAMFDFRETPTLDEALRLFLARFRLPGEAQKIDRMMEAFSKQYYLQTGANSPLADADAAYVLSFSIIMLNTDLHSDHIAKKMTVDEFVRNNRGINGGNDLPREYLTELYQNIGNHQIQMQHDVSDFMDANNSAIDRYSTQWDGVLKRSENVVGASFTSNSSILKLRAGLYEKEMFNLISETTITSILLAYEKTCDVNNMERALEGLRNCAKIALYYDIGDVFNRVMGSLASYFLTFAHGILSGEKVYLPPSSSGSVKRVSSSSSMSHSQQHRKMSGGGGNDDRGDSRHSGDGHDTESSPSGSLVRIEEDHLQGAKTRRALLSLKLLFQFVQNRSEYFRKAWSSVVECVLMFNELDVVPISLVEIDDFVDSRGVPLPPIQGGSGAHSPKSGSSAGAPGSSSGQTGAGLSGKTRERSRRLAERQAAIRSRMKSMSHGNQGTAYGTSSSGGHSNTSSGSIWDSLSSYLWAEEEKVDDSFSQVNKMLRDAVVKLGGGILEKENWLRMVRKLHEKSLISLLETLLACRDPFKCILQPSNSGIDAMMQENAILVLELSVDIILVNSHRILPLNLWDPFHMYAKRILSTPLNELNMQGLVERVVVHILRVCIRLFHDEKVRPKLVATLEMLFNMDDDMYKALSDRLASGINMLLKANLVYMHDFHDWNILLGILENVVEYKNGRAPCWESVKLLAEGGHLNDENVTLWIAICLKFVRHRTPYSVDALRLLQVLANNDSAYKMDGKTWLEVMRVMLSYLNDDRAPIAKTAWECLYNSLLQPGAPVSKDTWQQCFEDVIFAFDDQVNEGIWKHSKEASLYSVTLLSKTFLHNLNVLMELPRFRDLWLNVLRRLANKLVVAGSNAASSSNAVVVFETTLQSLYNLLLVLKAEEILEKVSNEETQQTLFDESCAVIDEVCPHVKGQLGLVPPQVNLAVEIPADGDTEASAHDKAELTQIQVSVDETQSEPIEQQVQSGRDASTVAPIEQESEVAQLYDRQGISEEVVVNESTATTVSTETSSCSTTVVTTSQTTTTSETVTVTEERTAYGMKADGILFDEVTEAV
ncbi:Protein kinase, partial [Globisporangium splendens]